MQPVIKLNPIFQFFSLLLPLSLYLSVFYSFKYPSLSIRETFALNLNSGSEEAITTAIEIHKLNSTDSYYYKLLDVKDDVEWGLGEAEKIQRGSGEVIQADYSLILAHKETDGKWRVVLPNEVEPYLDLLRIFPESLVDRSTKQHVTDAYQVTSQAIYSNHYLPWTKGIPALVYQNYSSHGEGQLDFGFSGFIRTSKAGTLVFAYDAHTWNLCAGHPLSWCSSNYPNAWYYNNAVVIKHSDGEYSAYLHLQTDSIPTDLIGNCNSGAGGNCNPIDVPVGTIVGIVGTIGYSSGVHLHFGTGSYIYTRCDYPDIYDEDGDGNTAEKNICTGGITGGYGVSTDFYEKPYYVPDCGTGAGQDATLCMLYYPSNVDLISNNPGGSGNYTSNFTVSDFDGDGKTDPAKFDLSTNTLSYLESSTNTWQDVDMGAGTFEYVPRSDFDGDGKTDPAMFVPSANALWYLESSTSTWQGVYMGPGSYTYVAGSDFDGDGKTDPALFLSSANALWYLESSTSTWQGVYMGPGSYELVVGSDFDGDGKTDPALFYTVGGANALWYLESSTSTWQGVYMGPGSYDMVAASDFDGDGQSDPALFVAGSQALWYLESGTSTWQGVYMGAGTYSYVAASDFDGDGKTDPAEYVSGTQTLWWLKSSTGLWDGTWMGVGSYDVVN